MSFNILCAVSFLGLSRLVPLFSSETINKTDHNGRTPLQYAVLFNNYKTASKLIQSGADVNTGQYPVLDFAVDRKKMEFVRLFLENGADPLKKAKADDYSSIEIAFRSKDPLLIKLFAQSEKVSNLAIAIGLSALKAIGGDEEFDYLEDEKAQEITKLEQRYSLRKNTFNTLGIEGIFTFEGKEFETQGGEAFIMQKQQAEMHEMYLEETKKPIDENEQQLIDYFNKTSTNHSELKELTESIPKGNLEGIITGYKNHASQVVFFKGYVALCNSNYDPQNGVISVFKIDPRLVTTQDVKDLIDLQRKEKNDANKKITQILDKWNAYKDGKCQMFEDPSVRNKDQKTDNCSAKSGNIAKRFIQVMQILPDTPLESWDLEQRGQIIETIHKVIMENKRQTRFRKLFTLEQMAKKGQLQEEDKDWFFEAVRKRLIHSLQCNTDSQERKKISELTTHPLIKDCDFSFC